MSIVGFFVGVRVEVVVDDNSTTVYDRSPFKFAHFGEGIDPQERFSWARGTTKSSNA